MQKKNDELKSKLELLENAGILGTWRYWSECADPDLHKFFVKVAQRLNMAISDPIAIVKTFFIISFFLFRR